MHETMINHVISSMISCPCLPANHPTIYLKGHASPRRHVVCKGNNIKGRVALYLQKGLCRYHPHSNTEYKLTIRYNAQNA